MNPKRKQPKSVEAVDELKEAMAEDLIEQTDESEAYAPGLNPGEEAESEYHN